MNASEIANEVTWEEFSGIVWMRDGSTEKFDKGRRKVSRRIELGGTRAPMVELMAALTNEAAGLADVEVEFEGELSNYGDYGYGGEIVDCYELKAVTVVVSGWVAMTEIDIAAVSAQLEKEAREASYYECRQPGQARTWGRLVPRG